MSDQIAKDITKLGTKVSKERLLDLIKKSPSKEFVFSSSNNSKIMVVVIR